MTLRRLVGAPRFTGSADLGTFQEGMGPDSCPRRVAAGGYGTTMLKSGSPGSRTLVRDSRTDASPFMSRPSDVVSPVRSASRRGLVVVRWSGAEPSGSFSR